MEKMMTETGSTFVIAAVKPRERVDRIIAQAQASGIPAGNISVIAPDDRQGRDPADEKPREGSEKLHDAAAGAMAGGVTLGILGCIAGLVSIAVPGLGFLIVGGPLAAALGDAAVGGALGAIAGGLLGLRVPEHRAKSYEESLRKGSTIISIHAANGRELAQARELLAKSEVDEILEVNGDQVPDEIRG
jgi:hypothetical protein